MFTPSHVTAVLLFALFTSVVFGITQRSEARAMVRYGVYCFCLFVADQALNPSQRSQYHSESI